MTGFNFSDLSWRAKGSYIAHIFKAAFKQHHKWMKPIFTPMLDDESVIFDIGGHSGQYAKLLARLAKRGRVYSFEPSGYSRSILNFAIKVNGFENIDVIFLLKGICLDFESFSAYGNSHLHEKTPKLIKAKI